MIELVMVIVLLGIIAVTSFVVIRSYQTHHLYAAAERIAADLRYAKNLALTTTKWHGASFNLLTDTYQLYETDGATDTVIEKPEDPAEGFVVDLANEYRGVGISSVNIDGGNKVEFSPLGIPYTDRNGSAIASTATITLSSGGSSVRVQIAPQSGRIYIL